MAKPALNYGVLKGTLSGHLRDADDDHYQILVSAGSTMFRIAINAGLRTRGSDRCVEIPRGAGEQPGADNDLKDTLEGEPRMLRIIWDYLG
jgi:hypothetical protein